MIWAYLSLLVDAHRPQWYVLDSLHIRNLDKTHSRDPWPKIAANAKTATKLLLPLHNDAKKHWSLAVVDRCRATIMHYDSVDQGPAILPMLCRIRDDVLTKRLNWINQQWVLRVGDCPLQRDNHSCGPFVLWWAREIVENNAVRVSTPIDSWRQTLRKALEAVPRQGRDDPPASADDDDCIIIHADNDDCMVI